MSDSCGIRRTIFAPYEAMLRLKKIDKLVLQAFIGPFILTFLVVVFILLVTQMLRYLNEIFGKGIGIEVLGQFIYHFSVFQTPVAVPLAVMLASLIAFGNLGEHSELTAIKGAGISLSRALVPIFLLVLVISLGAFYSNSYLVPKSALKAYSLLYDIRQKKPTLDIKEGVFYGGIDNFRIKVSEKDADGKTLRGLIIYDHSKGLGNTDVIVADSGLMYTIMNERYLKLELFDGNYYSEEVDRTNINRMAVVKPFNRTSFERSEIVFDLSIFDLKRTKEELFSTDRFMRNYRELGGDIDSIKRDILDKRLVLYQTAEQYLPYHKTKGMVQVPDELKAFHLIKDSLLRQAQLGDSTTTGPVQPSQARPQPSQISYQSVDVEGKMKKIQGNKRRLDSYRRLDTLRRSDLSRSYNAISADVSADLKSQVYNHYDNSRGWERVYRSAVGLTRQMKSRASVTMNSLKHQERERRKFLIQQQKLSANALACIIMFLIGAPLGAIIKKGGLGVPVFVSIVFFIIYYVVSMAAEKQSRQNMMDPYVAAWLANILLLPIGLFSLRQARKDARILELDYYLVQVEKLKSKVKGLRSTSS